MVLSMRILIQQQNKQMKMVVQLWVFAADSLDWYIIKMNSFLLNQSTKNFILLKSLGPNIIVENWTWMNLIVRFSRNFVASIDIWKGSVM